MTKQAKSTPVDCDRVIRIDWLKQTVCVFTSYKKAQKELTPLGATVACASAGAGYATNAQDGAGLFWIVFTSKKPTIGHIVHEATHIVDYLCEFAGIPISEDCAEVRCYMVEWLVDQLIDVYGAHPSPK